MLAVGYRCPSPCVGVAGRPTLPVLMQIAITHACDDGQIARVGAAWRSSVNASGLLSPDYAHRWLAQPRV